MGKLAYSICVLEHDRLQSAGYKAEIKRHHITSVLLLILSLGVILGAVFGIRAMMQAHIHPAIPVLTGIAVFAIYTKLGYKNIKHTDSTGSGWPPMNIDPNGVQHPDPRFTHSKYLAPLRAWLSPALLLWDLCTTSQASRIRDRDYQNKIPEAHTKALDCWLTIITGSDPSVALTRQLETDREQLRQENAGHETSAALATFHRDILRPRIHALETLLQEFDRAVAYFRNQPT